MPAEQTFARRAALILTCEHAGNRIPREHAQLFRGAGALLDSHRGWDPGALQLARLLSCELDVPLLATPWSRLLVEANRSLHHPRLWSERTRGLPAAERERILERYWRPHRTAVEAAVERALRRAPVVLHVAVHSFTPQLAGEVRNADVGLLYDSRCARESALARHWGAALRLRSPGLRVRYNYPYRGRDDGLTTSLRKQHARERYLGFELEANQALLAAPHWRSVGRAVAASLVQALEMASQTQRRVNSAAR